MAAPCSLKGGVCPPGNHHVHTPYFFHKGLQRRIYASEKGKACFVFCVPAQRAVPPAPPPANDTSADVA